MTKTKREPKSEALLWPLLDKAVELRREYRKRNMKFDQKIIKSGEIEDYLASKWSIYKKQKGEAIDPAR